MYRYANQCKESLKTPLTSKCVKVSCYYSYHFSFLTALSFIDKYSPEGGKQHLRGTSQLSFQVRSHSKIKIDEAGASEMMVTTTL
jgi:hypothetical protein